ncbi:MAG: DUF4381 domain-containing protein [Legionellaceae bacterium]|nr:DUF4381 domain-containing protein [Legionellaceae bacterium]
MPAAAQPNVPELAHLHDIHLPTPIHWWPLAPGWYLVIGLIMLIGLSLMYVTYRRYAYGQARRQALQALTDCESKHQHNPNSQRSTAAVSELLKRVALAYYPREQVAGLQGDAWLIFLNNTVSSRRTIIDMGKKNTTTPEDPKINFNQVRNELLEYPYQPPQPCDLEPLFRLVRTWIKHQRQVRRVCSN